MKKGFTLLELMIVIIIIGVLGTLGVMQYQAAIERARGAEARQIIGALRSACAAVYIEDNSGVECTTGNLRIGSALEMIPSPCRVTHFFSYGVTPVATGATFTATRCTGTAGKTPGAATAGVLSLVTNYGAGIDSWVSTAGY